MVIGLVAGVVVGATAWFGVTPLLAALSVISGWEWEKRDHVASVVSAVVAILALSVAVVFGVLQLRLGTQQPPALPNRDQETPPVDRSDDAEVPFPLVGAVHGQVLELLHVHPAIDLPRSVAGAPNPPDGVHLDAKLPTFVERDIGPEVEQWMRDAKKSGGFLVLTGDSCVGKSRLLYETACKVLGGFALIAPDFRDGDLVNRLASNRPTRPTVVWLDELQRFIQGPYLDVDATPISPATIRQLLTGETPIVILGTLWREHSAALLKTAIPSILGPGRAKVSRGRGHPHYDWCQDVASVEFQSH